MLEKTGLFIFFSTSSRISKAGRAVHDIKSASAPLVSNFTSVSDKYFGSMFAKSVSKSKLKVPKESTSIFFLEKYS